MDQELDSELQAHLEHETEKLMHRGLSRAASERQARIALGGVDQITQEVRRSRGISVIENAATDLRYAFRALRKSPGFTIIVVLTLALGIGANSSMYSVIHAVLLRPLPYPEPDRLVLADQPDQQTGIGNVTMAELQFWKEHSQSFNSIAGHRGLSDQMLVSGDNTIWIQTTPVTADFFRTLGVKPMMGREFASDELRLVGPQAVILTHGLWQRVFPGDVDAVGRGITIDNVKYTVVGVLPPELWLAQPADAFVPLRATGSADDLGRNTEMIARLKPGISLAQAHAEMTAMSQSYKSALRDSKNYGGLTVTPYQVKLVGDVRTRILLLSGAVALLFLIACFNLVSLLLARLTSRQKEIATRFALGGSRGRLLQQFLIENTQLTLGGALAGLACARLLIKTLVALVPFDLLVSTPVEIDASVLGFTLAVAAATSVAFSVAPAFAASRLDLKALRFGAPVTEIKVWRRMRSFLVAGQIALSVTLLLSAGLIIQSLYQMHRQQLGFDPHGVMTFATPSNPQQRRNVTAMRAFDVRLRERLVNLPGVYGAATVSVLPLTTQNNFPVEHEGHPDQDIGGMEIRVVSPGYFDVMKTSIVRGKSFNDQDISGATPVVLVNETVARKWWGSTSPLGGRVTIGKMHGETIGNSGEKPREVVGVVADTKSIYLKSGPRPTVYLPSAQVPWYNSGMNWVVRGDFPSAFAQDLRQLVVEVDPQQRVDRVRSMDEIVSRTMADSRFNAWLFGGFAGLALALAALGVYGLLAYMVAQRTREIGIRMALGAQPRDMLRLVLGKGMRLAFIGMGVGLIAAFASVRMVSSLLFGVSPYDVLTAVMVGTVLTLTALVACYVPARRAMKVDPLVALRYE
jgi:putative ABC transport system permease protein